MDFDEWTAQVTNRLNEHAEYIQELISINKEIVKKLDSIEANCAKSNVEEAE